MKPTVALVVDLPTETIQALKAQYTLIQTDGIDSPEALAALRTCKALICVGRTAINRDVLAHLPELGLVQTASVGHDRIDSAALLERGIRLANARGTNADCVADHTLGLMLAVLRSIPQLDRHIRGGGWKTAETRFAQASGKTVGLLGLGDIGQRIARRCAAFDMPILYHARSRIPEVAFEYIDSVESLASRSDILISVLPGNASTYHIVGTYILERLGRHGFLINVGRGSCVDSKALAIALETGAIAGAAIDVFEEEPALPDALMSAPNLIVTPHVAGRSEASAQNMARLLLGNLAAFFAGEPLRTPVHLGASATERELL